MARLASVVRWCGGWRERRARRQKLLRRRQHSGGTVWLGRRRSCRLSVSRLVRWRLVAALLRPIRKALMEIVAGAAAGPAGRRQLVTLPQLNFPFVGTLTLPAVA
ncbi:hypothetical protein SEVIR_3G025600v4 [Setaria viridis]|uniref:Uncharacterized protein n=2 Tax=Setaria TaxID=4554 RepID=A0A368QBB8_SETIT|nr:hypothetical protein SETIT_3G024900v2 [Setaria italica]TKW24030.1 hypothetical protein SEVIR_3G025600v2 [Setaria viridis]